MWNAFKLEMYFLYTKNQNERYMKIGKRRGAKFEDIVYITSRALLLL